MANHFEHSFDYLVPLNFAEISSNLIMKNRKIEQAKKNPQRNSIQETIFRKFFIKRKMLIDAQNNSVKGNRLIQNSKIALINLMKNPIASKKEKKKKGKTK